MRLLLPAHPGSGMFMGGADLGAPTCVQQQLHNVEVGVGDAVVQGCVAIPIGQVDHVSQEGWGELGKGQEVVGNRVRDGRLLAGQTEPLLQDQAAAGELWAAMGLSLCMAQRKDPPAQPRAGTAPSLCGILGYLGCALGRKVLV